MVVLKLKNVNFVTKKILILFEGADIDNILVSDKVSSGEKNYKNFISYIDNDYEIKKISMILPKMDTYIKSYDRETKWMYFFIEDDELLKNNCIWNNVTNSVKKSLIANSFIKKVFENKKKILW